MMATEKTSQRLDRLEKHSKSFDTKLAKTQEYVQTTIINDVPALKQEIDTLKLRLKHFEDVLNQTKWWEFWK